MDAQRGAVLFSNLPAQKLMPCPVCNRVHIIENGKLRKADSGEIKLSHTVANRVLSGGESVLFLDTDQDGELNAAESIMSLRLRSIICVPLRGKMGITGVLYMDSDRPGKQYTHDDMLLSTAVGNSAGLALENARMHIQILEKQRTDQEIEHAWTIQESFLVKEWPRDDLRFTVYGETRPAKIIGGDFYDFVRPSADTVGLLIGDVSGKGVPAALSMAQLLAEFRLHATSSRSPVEVVQILNNSLVARSQRGMFCTLCYSTLDLTTGRLCTANAGHHSILRVSKKGAQYLSLASGPPAGILGGNYWTAAEEFIQPGDSLLMYTDGIVEAHGPTTQSAATHSPDEYGPERLIEIAREQYGQPPEAFINTIHRHVQQFCAPSLPHDDCTMLALRYIS
ncbi:MAG: SpoIIE family protein phosphatase [Candidatus Hydrogenedentes bacterium]|nr:SpoIIE family protein phosphatase [Candidatus Hydrogenedentota bacterium]